MVQKSTRKYERAAKSTKAEAIIQLLHRLIRRGARVSPQSIIAVAVAVGGAPTVDSGTEGSECMGFQLFVWYAQPIVGSTWESMGVRGST